MNDAGRPSTYQVIYSGRVKNEFAALVARARAIGAEAAVIAAASIIEYSSQVYPQFGQPLYDLVAEPMQAWIACVAPLTVRYILNEDTRTVFVVAPFKTLRGPGL